MISIHKYRSPHRTLAQRRDDRGMGGRIIAAAINSRIDRMHGVMVYSPVIPEPSGMTFQGCPIVHYRTLGEP